MGEINIISSCSPPYSSCQATSTKTLQQRLRLILQTQPEHWVYSIFWNASKTGNGAVSLSWAGGHSMPLANPLIHELMDFNVDVSASEWFDFYTLSLTRSFAAGHGSDNILGRAFCSGAFVWLAGDDDMSLYECERIKEAHMYGVKTLVCIPTPSGVIELASLEVISEDWRFVQNSKLIFGVDKVSNPNRGRVHVPQLRNALFPQPEMNQWTAQGE